MPPRVSVIMSVYNGEQYLAEAIDSILGQTYTEFEFIIIDDASQDNSFSIVRDFARKDKRIRIIENQDNQGLSVSLNKGVRAARCEYIARMDADDISAPTRFEKQVAFMDANPEIGVCGTWFEMIGERQGQVGKFPNKHTAIHLRMLFANAMAHPTVMMRASLLERYSLQYDEQVLFAQDYELWSRAIENLRFANLDQVLLYYRVHSTSTGSTHYVQQQQTHNKAYRNVLSSFNMNPTQDELCLHEQISTHQFGQDMVFLRRARRWLERLSQANRDVNLLPSGILDAELGSFWTGICYRSLVNPVYVSLGILASRLPFCNYTDLRKLRRVAGFCYEKLKSVSLSNGD